MKRLSLLLFLLLLPLQADAQLLPLSFIDDSTKMLECTDTSSSVDLGTKGSQWECWNDGTAKVFLKLGGASIEAGTSSFVLGGKSYTLQTRNPATQQYIACVMAESQTTTVFCGVGNGQ